MHDTGRARARWAGLTAAVAVCCVALAAAAQAPPPLPPLPEQKAPPANPAPSGTIQDVQILPPLPPPPPEPAPAPLAPSPSPNATPTPNGAPTATVIPAATPTPTATPAAVETTVASPLAPRGVSLGVHLGVGFPIGEQYGQISGPAQETTNLGDVFGVLLLAQADVGYRLTPHWYVGGYFSAGIGTPATECKGSSQCDINDLRFGLDAKYSHAPHAFIDPWLEAGAGWEIANQAVFTSAFHIDGPEILHLRAGLDFRVTPHVYVAPEVLFTFAVFTDKPSGVSGRADELHDWLTLGVSAHFDL